ncbi:MAG: NAD(P)/FAD-dependent oxidoreductase, partial [Anaerolineales bacterium]
PFSRFFSQDLIDFFGNLGVQTTVERGGRVFPSSSDANEVVTALVGWMESQGVTRRTALPVTDLAIDQGAVQAVMVKPARNRASGRGRSGEIEEIQGRSVLIATGGVSYPGTGSTGDGYKLARSAGHTIVPIRPALIPVDTAGNLAQRMQGLTLKNVAVEVIIDGEPAGDAFGEMLFTHFGLSGPIILTLSRMIVDALSADQSVEVSIDLKPALDDDQLEARLLRDLDKSGSKHFRNFLKGLLPRKMIPVCIDELAIPAHKPCSQVTSEERAHLRSWLKDFRLQVIGNRPIAQAIVTAGGVATDEIDPRTMESRLVERLYFAGEVLDFDADTGGYNLQAAFSTGWLAGTSAAMRSTGRA